jgi:hypothetical protein
LRATLLDWLTDLSADFDSGGISLIPFLEGDPGELRQVVIAEGSKQHRMIRTPAWQLHWGQTLELYAKPDDRWESNDVASLCPEIVRKLTDLHHEYLRKQENSESVAITSLPEDLISPWR